MPIVQVLEALPRGVRDPGLVCRRSLFYSLNYISRVFCVLALLGAEMERQPGRAPTPRELTGHRFFL